MLIEAPPSCQFGKGPLFLAAATDAMSGMLGMHRSIAQTVRQVDVPTRPASLGLASLGKPRIWAAARRSWDSMAGAVQVSRPGRRLPDRVGQRREHGRDGPRVVGGEALDDRREVVAEGEFGLAQQVGQPLESLPRRSRRRCPVVAGDQHRQGERPLELLAFRLLDRGAREAAASQVRSASRSGSSRSTIGSSSAIRLATES